MDMVDLGFVEKSPEQTNSSTEKLCICGRTFLTYEIYDNDDICEDCFEVGEEIWEWSNNIGYPMSSYPQISNLQKKIIKWWKWKD